MSAIVFCLACQQVLDISEYLHPAHPCTKQHRRGPNPNILHPKQPVLPQFGGDDDVA